MQRIPAASVTIVQEEELTRFVCSGAWVISQIDNAAWELERYRPGSAVLFETGDIGAIDSAGIALLQLSVRTFETHGFPAAITGESEEHAKLRNLLYPAPLEPSPPQTPPSWLHTIGRTFHRGLEEIGAFLSFLGEAFTLLLLLLRHPAKIRWRSIGAHILATGAQALPIIAVSSFLIGIVVAYQSIVQLQKFGADIFIVDTIGISLSRELAPLITAIVVAGRSGSAFTAQIGTMKITQEIDAMRTMGFDPFTFLVWPRVAALMIVMPLLIFFADIVGIFGGMVIASVYSQISYAEFLHRLHDALALKHYLIGLAKGPFFAFLIAMVSLHRGFQVKANTESIGRYTTISVVNAIFLVIACDALFSVLLTELRL